MILLVYLSLRKMKKDSKLSTFSIASSNEFFREEFRVNLSEKHSECSVDGVIMTDNNNFGEVNIQISRHYINFEVKPKKARLINCKILM